MLNTFNLSEGQHVANQKLEAIILDFVGFLNLKKRSHNKALISLHSYPQH